jgi:hypothetical protein
MVIAHGARTAVLEDDNARLCSELEQAYQALVEADFAQNSLSVSQDEVEWECVMLRVDVDALKQSHAKIVTDHEADLTVEKKKFWDYRLSHRRKLHDLRVELEGAVNEIGTRCMPYPKKGITIGEIIMWFTKEIQMLPSAIAKANKNFLIYCLFGVLKMLQEHAKCSHVNGLETIMVACDASILDEVLEDIAKLSARIVKICWSSYGLPYITKTFRIEPKVRSRSFIFCCSQIIGTYFMPWFRGRIMAKVMPLLLVMALIFCRVLAMIHMPHERMPRLCKTLPKVEARNVMLMPRTIPVRCEEGQHV